MVSDKQKNILNFINIFVEKNGYAPSVREICTGVGLKSTSTVQYHQQTMTFIINPPIGSQKVIPSGELGWSLENQILKNFYLRLKR